MSAVLEAAAWTAAPPRSTAFAHDVLTGLAQADKRVPGSWLHDPRGRELFLQIAQREAYYPARAEAALLRCAASPMARACGRGAVVIELGRGSGGAKQPLLAALDAAVHLPIDPRSADFTQPHVLRAAAARAVGQGSGGSRLVLLLGGEIDHFPLRGAMSLLENIGQAFGRGTLLAVTADATQDPARLIPAYDDREGLCARFNKNLLLRINRELDGDLDPAAFEHQARWLDSQHRVETHLVARTAHQARVQGRCFRFAAGESVRTQVHRKHTLLMFRALVRHARWAQREFWMDSRSGFVLHLLEYLG